MARPRRAASQVPYQPSALGFEGSCTAGELVGTWQIARTILHPLQLAPTHPSLLKTHSLAPAITMSTQRSTTPVRSPRVQPAGGGTAQRSDDDHHETERAIHYLLETVVNLERRLATQEAQMQYLVRLLVAKPGAATGANMTSMAASGGVQSGARKRPEEGVPVRTCCVYVGICMTRAIG